MNFQEIFDTHFVLQNNVDIPISTVRSIYTNAYPAGINKFYKFLKDDLHLVKTNKVFFGFAIKPEGYTAPTPTAAVAVVEAALPTVSTPTVAVAALPVEAQAATPQTTMAEIEIMRLAFEKRKFEALLAENEKDREEKEKDRAAQAEIAKLKIESTTTLEIMKNNTKKEETAIAYKFKEKKLEAEINLTEKALGVKLHIHKERIQHEKEENMKTRSLYVGEYVDTKNMIAYGNAFTYGYRIDQVKPELMNIVDSDSDNGKTTFEILDDVVETVECEKTLLDVVNHEVVNAIVDMYCCELNKSEFKLKYDIEEHKSDGENPEDSPSLKHVRDIVETGVKQIADKILSIYDYTNASTTDENKKKAKQLRTMFNANDSDIKQYGYIRSDSQRKLDETNRKEGFRKTMMKRSTYLHEKNNIRMVDGEAIIDCYSCGDACELRNSERSHIVPKSKNGDCSKDNIRLCCKDCNRDCGDHNLDSFISMKANGATIAVSA